MGEAVLTTLTTLASAGLEATVLALLAVFLYQIHRQVGLIPLIFLLALLAFLVPLGAHASALDFGAQGAAPRVFAIVGPVFVGLVLLLHLLWGSRHALITAALPVVAGLLVALVALASRILPVFIPAALLPPHPSTAYLAGLGVSAGAFVALFLFHGLTKLRSETAVAALFAPAALVGTGFQGMLLFTAEAVGLEAGHVVWPAIAAVPVIVGIVPIAFISVFANLQTNRLDPEERRELLARSPLEGDSLVKAYERAEEKYKQGMIHGRAIASKYLELLESQPVGTYVAEPNGKLTYANLALAELIGHPGEDLKGQNITHLLGQMSNMGRPEPAKEPLTPGKHRIGVNMPSGRRRLVELSVQETSDGRLRGHASDLTHELSRLEVERQKQRATFYLDLLVDGVAGRLAGAEDVLAKMDPRSGRLPPDGQAIAQAVQAVDDVQAMTEHVDLLARAEEMEPEPVDALDLAERAADRAYVRLDGAWEVTWEGPDNPVLLKGAPLVGEALDVLVDVAARYGHPEHGIELRVESRGVSGWVICVHYAGDPLPEHSTLVLEGEGEPGKEGLDLGLYAVRAIAEQLGGWARHESGALKGDGREMALCLHLPASSVDPATWRLRGISREDARA